MKKNNGGYISAISLLIMAFFLLLTGAVAPRVGAELNFSSINSDVVEAQYAAEAGAKRAITEMLAENTAWGWLEETKGSPDKQVIISGKPVNDYYYSVFIETVASTPVPLTGKPVIGQQYKIISTGYVNGSNKKISVIYKMKAATSSGSLTDSTVYVQSLVGGQGTFYGKIVVGSEEPKKNKFTYVYEGEDEKPEWGATGLKFPKYNYETFKNDKTEPIPQALPDVLTDGIHNLANGKYYADNGLTIPRTNNNVTLNLQKDTVIMINGDFNIYANNFTITADTFVDKDGITKKYALLLVVFGNIDDKYRNNPTFFNTVLVSLDKYDAGGNPLNVGGNIRFKNNADIIGMVIADKLLDFKNGLEAGAATIEGKIVKSDRDLAEVFNEIAGGYEGETVTTAGEAEITNWKIE